MFEAKRTKPAQGQKKEPGPKDMPTFAGKSGWRKEAPYPDVAAAVLAHNRRLWILTCVMGGGLLASLGVTYKSAQPSPPQLFEATTKPNGEVSLQPVDQRNFTPELANRLYYIRQTIEDAWYVNATAMDRPNKRAFVRFVGNARVAMAEFLQKDNQYEKLMKNAAYVREAEILTATITGDTAVVRMIEKRWEAVNAKPVVRTLVIQMQIQWKPSDKRQVLLDNPLGLLITQFNFDEEAAK